MEVKQYMQIVWHWLWLLILGLVLGSLIAWGMSSRQEPVFQSSTRVQVMSAPKSASDAYSYFNDQQLARTYVQTLKTRPIREEVEKKLGISLSGSSIATRLVAETQLIDIIVESDHPQKAADIANALVTVFSAQNNELQSSRFQESETSLQAQIAQVDAQIAALQSQSNEASSEASQATIEKTQAEMARLEKEILTLQNDIDVLSNPSGKYSWITPTLSPESRAQLNEKELQLNQLQSTYNLYQQIYTNLVVLGIDRSAGGNANAGQDNTQSTLALYQEIRANLLGSYENIRLARLNSTSNIVPIEPAVANSSPIRPKPLSNLGLGAAIGIFLAAAIIFAIEYLDDTLKTSDQITQLLGLPVIGYIAVMEHDKDAPYVAENPRSPVSEAFRTLRTNLEFASVDAPLKSLLVVSAHPSEGKSTVASNLAVTLATSGKNVMLIDADLRRPRIHRFFGLSNRAGLSDLFRDSVQISDVVHPWKDTSLSVITSGGIPPNPADLLSSHKMVSILDELKQGADMVVVDAPPFVVADASILASNVDGVLLVIYPGKTPTDAALTTLEQMNRAGARVIGVVMNRIPRNRPYYYSGYRYYSSYYQGHYYSPGSEGSGKRKLSWRSRFRRIFGKKHTHANDPVASDD